MESLGFARFGRLAAEHPRFSRRAAVQAGAIGLLGLGMNHLEALRRWRPMSAVGRPRHRMTSSFGVRLTSKAKSVIYIFLSGGLSQLESFDLKPDAPAEIRGEFRPIATRTPGIEICEHLPRLAERSHLWALVRSLTHGSNDHSAGHHIMLTGRSDLPPGFDPNRPAAGRLAVDRRGRRGADRTAQQPAAGGRPAREVDSQHRAGHPRPVRGRDGAARDPWFIEASPFDPTATVPIRRSSSTTRSAPSRRKTKRFQAPSLGLPEGFARTRLVRTAVAAGMHRSPACAHSTPWRRASRSTSIARRRSRC